MLLYTQGNLDEALKFYQKAMKFEETNAPDSLAVATSYNNIGII